MKDLLEKIIAFFRRLLRLEKDIHKITKPITKIVDELDKLAERERVAANANTERAAQLLSEAETRREAAKEAQSFAGSLPKLGAR